MLAEISVSTVSNSLMPWVMEKVPVTLVDSSWVAPPPIVSLALPAPQFGTLAPFFNTVSDKLNAFNSDTSLSFKLNLVGSWSGGSAQRSMQLDFIGTNGNRLVASRDVQVTDDTVTLATFFSIDAGGNIVTNGTKPVIRSNNGSFTATSILLIAEQATRQTLISAV